MNDGNATFFAATQSSVSHDPSEIILICWFAAQEIFLITINVEMINTFLSEFLMNKVKRKSELIWIIL